MHRGSSLATPLDTSLIYSLDGFIDSAELDSLRQWTEKELQTLEPILWQRFDDGYVRDCHGDLHLAN